MKFSASLEQFEGPLDLMLHLIQKNKLELFDLDLDLLADQYCAYIRQVSKQELETASEFLVEFTILLEYKSRRLLPRKEAELDENYEEDQKERLVARLMEYQRYKEASQQFETLRKIRSRQLEREPASLIEEWSKPRQTDALIHVPLDDLLRAMRRVLQRQAILNPLESSVEIREISIEDRIAQILDRLPSLSNPAPFEDYLQDVFSLHELIVTFLAILELIHMQKLTFTITESQDRLPASEEGRKQCDDSFCQEEKETIWLYQI